MMEQHPDIATADGPMNSFVVCPAEGGPFPVLLFYMDALGKREELHTMARRLVTEQPDSPHQVLRELRCESYFACAQPDRWAPPEHIAQVEHALTASGAPHQLEWYAGVEHGFVFPQRGAIYNEAAAERHWRRLFELFGRTLRPMAKPATHHTLSSGEDHAH
jgi:carboxymethylenebutenolidase